MFPSWRDYDWYEHVTYTRYIWQWFATKKTFDDNQIVRGQLEYCMCDCNQNMFAEAVIQSNWHPGAELCHPCGSRTNKFDVGQRNSTEIIAHSIEADAHCRLHNGHCELIAVSVGPTIVLLTLAAITLAGPTLTSEHANWIGSAGMGFAKLH